MEGAKVGRWKRPFLLHASQLREMGDPAAGSLLDEWTSIQNTNVLIKTLPIHGDLNELLVLVLEVLACPRLGSQLHTKVTQSQRRQRQATTNEGAERRRELEQAKWRGCTVTMPRRTVV